LVFSQHQASGVKEKKNAIGNIMAKYNDISAYRFNLIFKKNINENSSMRFV